MDVTTVADDLAVLHEPGRVELYDGLTPDTGYVLGGEALRTLPRPPGDLLARVATVNDLHLGETVCGILTNLDLGPLLRAEPGEPPYPETMSRAAAAEIAASAVDAVVAKGDLTARGSPAEFESFLDCYAAVADRLHYVKGNHDTVAEDAFPAPACQEVTLPGVTLALLDTSVPRHVGGALSPEQLEWLDELGARGGRPVLVFAHHPVCDPLSWPLGPPDGSSDAAASYFGLGPEDSDRLKEVFARRPALAGYFSGHTHRNRVRRFEDTGDLPWVEVAAVKDFPGGWAEYRVFEGGMLQVFHRISSPAALDWSDRTRAMFGGLYPSYSFGSLQDRCFAIWPRRGALA